MPYVKNDWGEWEWQEEQPGAPAGLMGEGTSNDAYGTGWDTSAVTPVPAALPVPQMPTPEPMPPQSMPTPVMQQPDTNGPNIAPPVQQPNIIPTPPTNYGALGGGFTPDQNLIGSQLSPGQAPGAVTAGQAPGALGATPGADTSAARSLVSQNLGALSGSMPNRTQIAGDTLKTLDEQQANAQKLGIQNIGRAAARLGRLGDASMVNSSLGDMRAQLNQQREQTLRGLAGDVAGQTLNDRMQALGGSLSGLGALSGLDQQAYGNQVGERNYLAGQNQQDFLNRASERDYLANQNQLGYQNQLGERAYQSGLGQQAFQNFLAAQGQEFGQNNQLLSMLNSLYGNSVSPLQYAIGQNYQNQGQGANAGAGDLLRLLLGNQGGY